MSADANSGTRQSQRVPDPILVVDEAGLDDLMAQALQAPAVAVDTESNSLYAYYHRICLIQMSLPGADYLVDPLAVDVNPLGELFASSRHQKVLHAAENDILAFKRDFGFDFDNIFDTMLAARILGWPRAGLAAILEEHFDVKLDKRLQRTNWGQRPLRADQLAYAQMDSHFLLSLRDQQSEELRQRRRWREAQENFQGLKHLEWTEKPFEPDDFWKVNGVRDLTPAQQAVLREVFLYREHQAQHQDRPPFKIFDRRVMLALSRSQPQNLGALSRIPGMTQGQVRRHGRGLLAAIAQGRQAKPPKPLRRPRGENGRPDPQTAARFQALRSWRTQRAEARGVDPDIVLANDALWIIANQAPETPEALAASNVMGPWKLQEYGAAILEVLANT